MVKWGRTLVKLIIKAMPTIFYGGCILENTIRSFVLDRKSQPNTKVRKTLFPLLGICKANGIVPHQFFSFYIALSAQWFR